MPKFETYQESPDWHYPGRGKRKIDNVFRGGSEGSTKAPAGYACLIRTASVS